MTRRDFQALAEAIAQAKTQAKRLDLFGESSADYPTYGGTKIIETLERQIISVCKRQNAAFDEARFLAAAAGPGR